MKSVLSIDVANGKSEVLLITEKGEILIEPYGLKHCLSEFNNLKNIVDILKYNSSKVNEVKQNIIELAKQTPYFEIINSIFGIGETSTAQIIAELGDINRFDNIKQLNAFCGLDPTIIQSGKSINYNGPISKRENRTVR